MRTSRIAAFEEILIQEPNDVTTHYMLGSKYFKAQMYDQAVGTFPRSLAIADEEGAVYQMLARSLLRLENFDEVRQADRNGLIAPARHGHQPMVEEYSQALKGLDSTTLRWIRQVSSPPSREP